MFYSTFVCWVQESLKGNEFRREFIVPPLNPSSRQCVSIPTLIFVSLPFFLDLIPEVNYTVDPSNSRGHTNPFNVNPPKHPHPAAPTSPAGGSPNGNHPSNNNPGSVFVPSPVSSKSSPTMFNMDQLTNNIAIPKHVLPNPSNLATSRSTVVVDDRDRHGDDGVGGEERDERFMNPNSPNNHLDEHIRGGETHPYSYDDEDGGLNEESKGFMGAEAQGKRGIWKGDGLEQSDSRDGNGRLGGVNYFIWGNGQIVQSRGRNM